jgi:hypothetical protein
VFLQWETIFRYSKTPDQCSLSYTIDSLNRHYRRLLSVLPAVPVALGAGIAFAVAALFPAAAVVMPVALFTAFLTTPVFLTMVV